MIIWGPLHDKWGPSVMHMGAPDEYMGPLLNVWGLHVLTGGLQLEK